MTNYQRLRLLSREELAEALFDLMNRTLAMVYQEDCSAYVEYIANWMGEEEAKARTNYVVLIEQFEKTKDDPDKLAKVLWGLPVLNSPEKIAQWLNIDSANPCIDGFIPPDQFAENMKKLCDNCYNEEEFHIEADNMIMNLLDGIEMIKY